jgi:hypothetical protein
MGRLTTFGLEPSQYDFSASDVHQQKLQIGFGGRVRASERMVMLSGGFDKYGVSPSPAEVGTITLTLKLYASTPEAMEAKRRALARIQNFGLTILKYQETDTNQGEIFTFARCTNLSMPQDQANHGDLFQNATVSWEVPYPVWSSPGKAESFLSQTFVWGESVWDGNPDTINASGLQTDGTTTNNGTAIALPIITIECDGTQSCDTIYVQRLVDGEVVDEIIVYETVGNNETLTINCRKRSIDLDGANKIAFIEFLHPTWLRILPGENDIRILFANASDEATVLIEYYEDFHGA